MIINGYELGNEEKLNRVIQGTMGRMGQLTGGLGENATPEAILAHYDKLGGLITLNGLKVKTGAFWDIEKKQPRAEPQVTFITSFDGDLMEVNEEEAKTIESAKARMLDIKKKKLGNEEDKPKKRGRPFAKAKE